jgi:diguanylate cyclase (GGDEF)-like protein
MQYHSAQGKARPPTDIVAPWGVATALPYVPLLISMSFVAAFQVRGQALDLFQLCVLAFVTGAILLRQLLTLQVIETLSGELHSTVAVLREREVELHYQAFHDPLTGLANRALFANRLGHALMRTRRPGPVFLLLADLDDFKAVNDTLGHLAGDALLVTVAERLRAAVRPGDTIARLGGDEFAVLLETADSLDDARGVADRIGTGMLEPFYLAGLPTVIGASVGISVGGAQSSAEGMLRDADIAMYVAKARGKGGCAVYAAEFAAESLSRLQLKTDLTQAMSRTELSLRYVPVVDLDSGQMTGVETLLHWQHPLAGSVPATVFIPLAEASGDIVPIGRWVLIHACAQIGRAHEHRRSARTPLELSVPVSGRQLTDPHLIPAIRTALAAADLAPQLLTLEITESALLGSDSALPRLAELRSIGVHLAIRDFGTGHCALELLRRFPIDTLKVDHSFVSSLTPSAPVPDVLITALLALGHGFGMTVIAEGVETEGQLTALRALGCRRAQGPLFARPLDAELIGDILSTSLGLADPVVVSPT